MKLHLEDWIGTVLVAATLVPYTGYLVRGSAPFVEDPRGMAAVGLVFGIAAAFIMRRARSTTRRSRIDLALLGTLIVLGTAAFLLAETFVAEAALAVFMLSIVGLWAVRFADHAGLLGAHGGGTPVAHQ